MEKVGMFLNHTLKKIGISKKIKEEMALYQWEKEAGPQVLQHTRAVRMKGGILFVYVDNSHWAQHLSFYKQSLINKLNHKLGSPVVKDIHFKVGATSKPDYFENKTALSEESVDLQSIILKNQEIVKIEETVKTLPEGNFREKVRNILTQEAKRIMVRKEQGWLECRNCGVLFSPQSREMVCPICRLKK